MIHNLEIERRRIDEALDVLRRLHEIRRPSAASSQNAGGEQGSRAQNLNFSDATDRAEKQG